MQSHPQAIIKGYTLSALFNTLKGVILYIIAPLFNTYHIFLVPYIQFPIYIDLIVSNRHNGALLHFNR